VLLVVGLVRADAASVEDRAATARSDGDCEKVVRARGDLWFGHRIAGARDAAGVDGMVKLCERLRAADGKLSEGLSGNRAALDDGYRILAAALEDSSDNRATVTTVLDSFLSGLRRDDPCQTVTVTDWLLGRDKNGNILDTSADVAAKTAPQALIDCADARMSESDWDEAQVHYQQVLDEYPDEVELGSQARTGVGRATRAIELKQVRGLLRTNTPGYCAEPAKYSGAAPFRKGTNRVLFVGDGRSGQLPGTWRTDDPERAVLIACVGDEERGVSARTCPYTYGPSGRSIANVTFHKIAIPVRVFELRTGKLVADRKLQISGASCPPKIKYYSDYFSDHGPDKHQDVKPSREDIRRAYRPLIFK
jgi:hypothetical protein